MSGPSQGYSLRCIHEHIGRHPAALYRHTVDGHGREDKALHLPPVLFLWYSKGMGIIRDNSKETNVGGSCPQQAQGQRRDSKNTGPKASSTAAQSFFSAAPAQSTKEQGISRQTKKKKKENQSDRKEESDCHPSCTRDISQPKPVRNETPMNAWSRHHQLKQRDGRKTQAPRVLIAI